jgi:hypothetical protein
MVFHFSRFFLSELLVILLHFVPLRVGGSISRSGLGYPTAQ